MKQSRRKFIVSTGSALVGAGFQRVIADGNDDPVHDITSQLVAAGFNPNSSNSSLMAIIGDLHINLQTGDPKFTDRFDDTLVAELNSLTPSITDLTIAGDIIVHHSVSIGGPRYSSHYELSRQEFRVAKTQMERFGQNMSLRAVPGNHDTDREEDDAQLWREELKMPPFQKCVLGGVPVFFLNSGQAGMLDENQRAWFEAEAKLIHKEQEVLIVAHHPSFYYVYEEIGLKKIVARAFSMHQATVWLVGGHGHGFAEQMLVSGSTKFVQMEVTTANRIQWGDAKKPGYVLLALQSGRVLYRCFRSVDENSFQVLKPVNQLTAYPLKWVFDPIAYPAITYEEGFYDRSGRLVSFVGIDLKSHLIVCRSYTVRVNLSKSRGKIKSFLLPANIAKVYAPPVCEFSNISADGPWFSVSYPVPNGQSIYSVEIPLQFRETPNLYIRTKTQLQGSNDGISVYGWGLGADVTMLSGYEKWLASNYRTILLNDNTAPTAIPSGSNMTNIEHYAFNVSLPYKFTNTESDNVPSNISAPIRGAPAFKRNFRHISSFQFARRIAEANSLVTYSLEISSDLIRWVAVPESQLAITRLNNGWEEVCLNTMRYDRYSQYYRVVISSKQESQGESIISAGDIDANGVDDLVQYAFDLQPQTGFALAYNSERLGHVQGLPVLKHYQGLCSTLRFARVRKETNPGVSYSIEETSDLKQWSNVPSRFITERILRANTEWEEVEIIMMDAIHSSRFYRISLNLTEAMSK